MARLPQPNKRDKELAMQVFRRAFPSLGAMQVVNLSVRGYDNQVFINSEPIFKAVLQAVVRAKIKKQI